MAEFRNHDAADPSNAMMAPADDEGVLGTSLTTRQIEAFGKKVTATASHLIGDASDSPYPSAMTSLTKQMKRPTIQRGVLSFAQTTPTDLVRSKLSTSEISHRAITRLPDELLRNLPQDSNTYSLFQGFQASLPDGESEHRKSHRRRTSRGQKLLGDSSLGDDGPPSLDGLKKDRNAMNHRLEMMGIRKNLCSTEIHEIDNKISNLNTMRKIVLDRLADLENDEDHLERDLLDLDIKIDNAQEALEDAAALDPSTTKKDNDDDPDDTTAAGFMSESIYSQLPNASPNKRRPKPSRRKSMPVLHEHLTSGSNIRTIPAHTDAITALDFDLPFGTLVTAALDDTVRVWDLNLGRCMGFLEGHTASVRCLQVEDTLVATGSSDASIRLWDLSRAHYDPSEHRTSNSTPASDDGLGFENPDEDAPPPPPPTAMADCPLFVLDAHVAEVTALHLRGETLVSGSADKTLRQWDLSRGRCVQTLDVLWAAAQAAATLDRGPTTTTNTTDTSGPGLWKTSNSAARLGANADFVGALQSFEAALACGTADGMVRLWDLRSGQVHRSLVGHTGAVTALQFDETYLVTGSQDRSVRIWDLRTGAIHDAYAYTSPISSLMFDTRRIVAAAGEDVTKVYDKTDGRHWDCGAGAQVDEMGETEGKAGVVERVRIRDGYLVEGRRDGIVGVWTC